MEEFSIVFELEYCDRATGDRVYKEVGGMKAAQQLARELAKASGRRAVIRQKRVVKQVETWSVHVADPTAGSIQLLWSGLTRVEVARRWLVWNARHTGCVLLAWPDAVQRDKPLVFAA